MSQRTTLFAQGSNKLRGPAARSLCTPNYQSLNSQTQIATTVYIPSQNYFCGISPTDGTVDFYLRINSLKNPRATYLDYGAGRAEWFEDDTNDLRRALRSMKGKFAEVIAADVDPVVLQNNSADKCLMIEDNKIETF